MLLKWLFWTVGISLAPVHILAKKSSDDKLSQDFIQCEKGWYLFGDKCYKVGGKKKSGRLTWEKAAERCVSDGGHLASIHSQEQQDFITTFLLLDMKHRLWIGLHDKKTESSYEWHDESTVNYTSWEPMEPTGPTKDEEDCAEMAFISKGAVGQWNDLDCNMELPYICQIPKSTVLKRTSDPRFCPADGGTGWKYQNSCYSIVTDRKSWDDAEKHCQDILKGHLAMISDFTVDLFLNYILSNFNKEVWIGIKMKEQLQLKWTSGWHVAYNEWGKDQGDFVDGTCALRAKKNLWTTAPCSKAYPFVCEISSATPPVLKQPPKEATCPEFPEDWRDLDGEYCYFFDTVNSYNWYRANFECIRRGGSLASIHSKEESQVLQAFIKYTQDRIYIGHHRLIAHENLADDVFVWTDGSPMDFENWEDHEPNNEDEKCGEVWSKNMKWNDAKCDETKGYICSVKKVLPNTTSAEINSTECSGGISLKALIGVIVCILLIVILLGVVIYFFRRGAEERRKKSNVIHLQPPVPSGERPRYRSNEMIIKNDEPDYETMQ